MDGSPVARSSVRFGPFLANFQSGDLCLDGHRIKLQEQPLQILNLLLERPGEVVTREQIRRKLWPTDTFVDFEHGINTAVRKLRAALEDDPENPRYIETIPRHGYRFLAPVSSADVGGARHGMLLPTGQVIALSATVLLALMAALLGFDVGGLRDKVLAAVGASSGRRTPLGKIESIAVLPLENLSRDPEQEYFTDGMTEELITYLSKVSALRVISRTSVMQYKHAKKPLTQIARELNVDAIVEGAVLRSGNRVRITTQLIQANPEKHLWANSYERNMEDVLVLQSEVARAVASEIQIKLTPDDQTRLRMANAVDPEAYEAFVKGRHFWNVWTPEGQLKCVQYYGEAIQKDSQYALAWAQMAHCYDMLAFMEQPLAREYQQKAHAAAEKALELDDHLAEAHMIFADQKYWVDWDWTGGEAAFRRALELNPASVDVVIHYGYALEVQGRAGEATSVFERAVQLDPLSQLANSFLGLSLYNGHQDARAVQQYRKMIELEPNNAGAYGGLGRVHEAMGRTDEAVSAYLKAVSLSGESTLRVEALRSAYKAGGLRGYWKKQLDYLKDRAKRKQVSPWTFASFCVHAGEKEQALEWLEEAYQQHTPTLVWLKADRTWDPLRSDPRFLNLLRRMNFPA